ncbi:transcription elongation protein SprT [Kribbella deserti]|uniref:Transcription elongation protein SprT n=1 Tax=Kribbella deserti TaxID=1926257 RepID=A0ABV6QGM5_9ACTN
MTATTATHTTRESWLIAAVEALTPMFTELGHEVPPVRISVGFPSGKGSRAKAIGQCWHGSAAADGLGQVFVSPILGDVIDVLETVAHELVHAINHANGDNGHGRPFAKIAKKLGFEAPMTSSPASEELKAKLREIAAGLGEYPHAALTDAVLTIKKQGTRMLLVKCPDDECGYQVRTTAKWLAIGVPTCPCGEEMEEA